MISSFISLLYFLIGFSVAISHGYSVINSLSSLVTFLAAVALWPAVLLGLQLNINLGF